MKFEFSSECRRSPGPLRALRCLPLYLMATLSIVLFAMQAVHAQISTATVNGTIKDATGAIILDAEVSVRQQETNFSKTASSNASGEFTLPNLPVGNYQLDVTKSGFRSYKQTGILLQVSQTINIPIVLQVGVSSETVHVSSNAPLVETTDQTLSYVIGQQSVQDLPLNARNAATLVYTAPGVNNALLNGTSATNPFIASDAGLPNSIAVQTNGVRAGGTYFSLDGANNVDPYTFVGGIFPNPDATQEFSVVTASYGAQYASAPGGAVNIVSRSGANQIHGTLFEFNRNPAFNATNYFSVTPDSIKRNQFGGALGGPIFKNKWFALASYQRTNETNPQVSTVVSPTQDERNGIFQSPTGAVVQIPSFLWSPVAVNSFPYIPLPNDGVYYTYTQPIHDTGQQWLAKTDVNLGQNFFFLRYFSDHFDQPALPFQANNPLSASPADEHDWNSIAAGDVWTSKSGQWISDAKLSYIWVVSSNRNPRPPSQYTPASLGIQGVSVDPSVPGVGLFTSEGFGIPATGDITSFPRRSYNATEDVSHFMDKHQLTFGANYSRILLNEYNTTGRNPIFYFYGINSLILFGPLNDNTTADYLIGMPFLFLQQDGFFATPTGNVFGLYAQDKFRVTDRLTLVGGLRWDPYYPYTQAARHMTCFISGQQSDVFANAPEGANYAGDSGCPAGGTSTKLGNIEPRVGLALQTNKAGTTALRGGWGMYTMQLPLQGFTGFSGPPFTRSFEYEQLFLTAGNIWPSVGLIDPFTGGFHNGTYNPPSNIGFSSAPGNFNTIANGFRPPVIQQYTLSLQQAFGHKDAVEFAYAGTHGTDLTTVSDANRPNPHLTNMGQNLQAGRPYQAFQTIYNLKSDASSSYNGLNVTYRHQDTGGVNIQSAFTWSKCVDEGSLPAQSGGNGSLTEWDNDPRLMRGRCDFDQNLTWRTTGVAPFPKLENSNSAVRAIIGSWLVSGVFTWDAGQPFSVADPGPSYTGEGGYADYASPRQPVWVNGVLNYNAFTAGAPYTYGDTGRNSFRSASFTDFDTAVMKIFPISERWRVAFRAEAFNTFNHPNFYNINSQYGASASAFGHYSSARDPRIMQLSLKVQF